MADMIEHLGASTEPADPLTALINHAATDIDRPPRYEATNEVICRGDPLSRELWRGYQWSVTTYGLQARSGLYSIARCRLWEDEDGQHGWVRHMATKRSTDIVDFSEGLRVARHLHAKSNPQRKSNAEV